MKPAEKAVAVKPFDAARYERFFEHPYLNEAARKFLYNDRLLDPRVIRWCRLTSWTDLGGTNWLQTPYYDVDGKLVGVQNRNLDYRKGTDGIRFRFPSGSQCHIYNLPVLKMLREGEPLYITEGCSDCWAMLSAGHKAIAIPSATLLKPEDAKMLSELTQRLSSKVRMYPDQDLPGEDSLPSIAEDIARYRASSTACRLQRLRRILCEPREKGGLRWSSLKSQ